MMSLNNCVRKDALSATAKQCLTRTARYLSVVFAVSSCLLADPAIAQDSSSVESGLDGRIETETPATQWVLIDRLRRITSRRLVMHVQPPDARLAMQLESLMFSLGLKDVEVRYVDQVPDTAQVRYYHNTDAQAGQAVADVLALVFDDASARDFKSYQPSPEEGLIEIWLP